MILIILFFVIFRQGGKNKIADSGTNIVEKLPMDNEDIQDCPLLECHRRHRRKQYKVIDQMKLPRTEGITFYPSYTYSLEKYKNSTMPRCFTFWEGHIPHNICCNFKRLSKVCQFELITNGYNDLSVMCGFHANIVHYKHDNFVPTSISEIIYYSDLIRLVYSYIENTTYYDADFYIHKHLNKDFIVENGVFAYNLTNHKHVVLASLSKYMRVPGSGALLLEDKLSIKYFDFFCFSLQEGATYLQRNCKDDPKCYASPLRGCNIWKRAKEGSCFDRYYKSDGCSAHLFYKQIDQRTC